MPNPPAHQVNPQDPAQPRPGNNALPASVGTIMSDATTRIARLEQGVSGGVMLQYIDNNGSVTAQSKLSIDANGTLQIAKVATDGTSAETPGAVAPPVAVGPEFVSALPINPTAGKEVYYQDANMAPAGVVWHLRYNASSTSTYKWEFVGGGDWYIESTGSGVSLDLALQSQTVRDARQYRLAFTGAPQITVARPGQYMWTGSCDNWGIGDRDGWFVIGPHGGTSTPSSGLTVNKYGGGQFRGGHGWGGLQVTVGIQVNSANTVLGMYAWCEVGFGTITPQWFNGGSNAFMLIRPIRIS